MERFCCQTGYIRLQNHLEHQYQQQSFTSSLFASTLSGPRLLQPGPTQSKAAVLEMCLAAADGRSRTRLLHRLGPASASSGSSYSLLSIEIHKERWDSPYRNGEVELTQCGGAQPAFATGPKLQPEALQGEWVPSSGMAYAWVVGESGTSASLAGGLGHDDRTLPAENGGPAEEGGRLSRMMAGEKTIIR